MKTLHKICTWICGGITLSCIIYLCSVDASSNGWVETTLCLGLLSTMFGIVTFCVAHPHEVLRYLAATIVVVLAMICRFIITLNHIGKQSAKMRKHTSSYSQMFNTCLKRYDNLSEKDRKRTYGIKSSAATRR